MTCPTCGEGAPCVRESTGECWSCVFPRPEYERPGYWEQARPENARHE